ncbi:MAG: DMT family transporter [Alphaproteobacteria bacterium]
MTDRNPARHPPSDAVRGGLWMLAGALSFTLMTALIREVAQEIHPFEVGFFRTVVNFLLILPFAIRTGRSVFTTSNHRLYAFRGLVGVVFLMTFFTGAAMIQVSDSQALIFTSPLFTTVLAVLFLGERLRMHRISALVIGFAGALIILRPGFTALNIGALLVLMGALANATSNAIVKHSTRTDHPDKVVFFLMLYVTPVMAIPAAFVWTTPDLRQLVLMIGVGIFATLNQRFLSRAFASADATAVLSFDFARLPFAALVGWIVFSELPDIWTWIGGAVIFSASIYIAFRESRLRKTG